MNKSISELDAADTIGQDDILLVSQKTANGYTSKKVLASNFKGAAGESGLPAIEAFKAEQTKVNANLQTSINSVSGGYFKAFDTLANLNAATGMAANQVAKVMNDPTAANNGDYRYNGSAWVKGYDALTNAKSYTDTVKMAANRITGFIIGGYSSNAPVLKNLDRAYSPLQYNSTGADYTVTVTNNDSANLWFMLSSAATPTLNVNQTDSYFFKNLASKTFTVTAASPYFIVMIKRADGANITQADIDNVVFTSNSYVARQNNVDDRFAKINADLKNASLVQILATAFVMGSFDSNGNEIDSTYIARSLAYNLPVGESYLVVNTDPTNIWIGTVFSDNQYTATWNDADNWYNKTSPITVGAKSGQPWARVLIRKVDKSPLTADDIAKVKVYMPNRYTTEQFVLNSDNLLYQKVKAKLNAHLNTTFLDVISPSAFVMGSFDNTFGNEIDSTYIARSPVYQLKSGESYRFENTDPTNIWVGVAKSSMGDTGFIWNDIEGWYYKTASQKIAYDATKPFNRVLIRKADKSPITSDDIAKVKVYMPNRYTTEQFVIESVANLKAEVSDIAKDNSTFTFNSNYRAVSKATTGLVSFIDDDGRDGVYSILNPIFKNAGVPFAAAIVPNFIDTAGFLTLTQLKEIVATNPQFEVISHTMKHLNLSNLTELDIHTQVRDGKKWFAKNGFSDDGVALPYGGDNALVRDVVAQYYKACYDFNTGPASGFILTTQNIRNSLIKRSSFDVAVDRVASHKTAVDWVAANGGWLIVTTHVNNGASYWDSNSAEDLQALIDYIKTTTCKIVKPRDGFQAMGNFIENDSGFRINANGVTINTAWT